jgi:hypothetical protein
MKEKFYKFHFKNDTKNKVYSCHVELDSYKEASKFAYDKLQELNDEGTGYRIVGVYEILYPVSFLSFNQQVN